MSSPSSILDGLDELGRARLDSGVSVYIECQSNQENFAGPRWLLVTLDAELLSLVETAREHCSRLRWKMVELQKGPADYDEAGSEARIKYWSLRVDSIDLWFYGQTNGDSTMQSHMIGQEKLVAALNAPAKPGQQHGECILWYGGALVCSNDDLEDFAETLAEAFPALGARERELEMAQVLSDRADALVDTPPERRRPRI